MTRIGVPTARSRSARQIGVGTLAPRRLTGVPEQGPSGQIQRPTDRSKARLPRRNGARHPRC